MDLEDYISIGRITAAQGLKGNLRLKASADSISSLTPGSDILILLNEKKKNFIVQSIKVHGKGLLLLLKGIESREEAESLKGAEVLVCRDCLELLEEGVWYWKDLIGLDVYDVKNIYIGQVDSIFPTGSNDVYVVKNQQEEILVPALEWVVKLVDLDARTMVVDLPEGLI